MSNKRHAKHRTPFHVGDTVVHGKFGKGTVIDKWGSIPFRTSSRETAIVCEGIYTVRFHDTIHSCFAKFLKFSGQL